MTEDGDLRTHHKERDGEGRDGFADPQAGGQHHDGEGSAGTGWHVRQGQQPEHGGGDAKAGQALEKSATGAKLEALQDAVDFSAGVKHGRQFKKQAMGRKSKIVSQMFSALAGITL